MGFLKTKWGIGVIIVLVIAVAIGLVVKRNYDLANLKKPAAASVAVKVTVVKQGTLPIAQHYMGKVEPVQAADIASRVTANVLTVTKREGDTVAKGEVLLLLDDLALASKARAIEAELRAAESIAAAARSSYQVQQASFERDEYLYKNKAVSLESYEKSRAVADNALSQVRAADERVRIAAANYSAAQVEWGYTRLTAPFDGVVEKRTAEPGETAVPGKTLLRLQGTGTGYKIIAQIPQEQLGRIKVGTKAVITGGQSRQEAAVAKVYPALAANYLATVEVITEKLPYGLPAGATIGLDLIVDQAEGFIVPVNALVKSSERTFVVVIADGIAKQVPVTIHGQTDEQAVVSGALDNAVVAVGQQSQLLRLMNGVKVKPAEAVGDPS